MQHIIRSRNITLYLNEKEYEEFTKALQKEGERVITNYNQKVNRTTMEDKSKPVWMDYHHAQLNKEWTSHKEKQAFFYGNPAFWSEDEKTANIKAMQQQDEEFKAKYTSHGK